MTAADPPATGRGGVRAFLHGDTALGRAAAMIAVPLVLALIVWASFSRTGVTLEPGTLWQFRARLWRAFVMTVAIALAALVVSLLIGVLAAAGRRSSVAFVRYLATTYVEMIRGTPLLVQIYFFYYAMFPAWGLENRYVAGVVILSLFEGAYIAEIIRGGWASIDDQTWEVARALALTPAKTFRLVTLPILLRRVVPALAGQFASVIKDSSLLSVIAVFELTQATQENSAENFQFFVNYLFVGLLYLALAFPVSRVSAWLERRLTRALGDS